MRFLKISALVVLLIGLAVGGAAIYLMQSVDPNSTAKTDFVVKSGESTMEVARQLQKNGLIKNSFFFVAYLKLTHSVLIPGTYEVAISDSASAIAEQLSVGRFKVVKITLIEGWRASDIERYLIEEKKLSQFQGFSNVTAVHEGYLFPDSYEIAVDTTSDQLIQILRENYIKRTKGLSLSPDQVILASIVEREAASDTERSDIAAVYLNRLRDGMKLQADPTIQYAKGNWKAVTIDEYSSVSSPYNTYLNEGLPPGPICNPGLKSLQAVVNPSSHNYYFFFHAKGKTFFSTTYTEHSQKVKANF